jgi:hypothetical protein
MAGSSVPAALRALHPKASCPAGSSAAGASIRWESGPVPPRALRAPDPPRCCLALPAVAGAPRRAARAASPPVPRSDAEEGLPDPPLPPVLAPPLLAALKPPAPSGTLYTAPPVLRV